MFDSYLFNSAQALCINTVDERQAALASNRKVSFCTRITSFVLKD